MWDIAGVLFHARPRSKGGNSRCAKPALPKPNSTHPHPPSALENGFAVAFALPQEEH